MRNARKESSFNKVITMTPLTTNNWEMTLLTTQTLNQTLVQKILFIACVSVTSSWLLASPEPGFGGNAGIFFQSHLGKGGWAEGRVRASQTPPGSSERHRRAGAAAAPQWDPGNQRWPEGRQRSQQVPAGESLQNARTERV